MTSDEIKVLEISPQGYFVAAVINNRIFIKMLNCPDWHEVLTLDDSVKKMAPFYPIYLDTDYHLDE